MYWCDEKLNQRFLFPYQLFDEQKYYLKNKFFVLDFK